MLVMDPLGNIPMFLAALKDVPTQRQTWVLVREVMIAFLILAIFLFFGKHILNALNLSEAALNISGGIVLFLIALKMIFPTKNQSHDDLSGEPFIVPLAIPFTAGPSALATVVIFVTQSPQHVMMYFSVLVTAIAIFLALMLAARHLMRFLGKRGLIAMERLMGMILTTISVQMFLSGIAAYFGLHRVM